MPGIMSEGSAGDSDPTCAVRRKADLRPQVLRIGCDGSQGLGRRPEEDAVDHFLVLVGDRGNLFRHGKDDMIVGNVEELGLTVFDPLRSGQRLAFWAMSIAAGNGEISITCLMESNFLWGVGRQKGMLRVASRPLNSPLRLGLQKREQFVRRAELALAKARRYNRFNGLELFGRISSNVDLRRGQIAVPQPQRDFPDVLRCL